MFNPKSSSFQQFLATIIIGAIVVALILAILDPKGIYKKQEDTAKVLSSGTYAQLLAFEPMQHDKARLGYVNGTCETTLISKVFSGIEAEGRSDWFFGIPLNGTKRKAEYINLVYVDHFERILCAGGEYYRARLNVQGQQCRFVESLITCGTDFFTKRTYDKMVHELEKLGVGDADYFKPRRTIRQKACECN